MRRSIVLLSAVLALLGGGAAFAQNAAPRNLILFIPDGLRALKVTRETAPAMAEVRDKGVNFKNPHSLFPTFTMANGSATAKTTRVPARHPPTIVRSDPGKGRTDIALNVSATVVFSEPIDSKSVNSTSVYLLEDGNRVSGNVVFGENPWTIKFVPEKPLDSQSSYELVVTPAIRDLDGDALEGGYHAQFVTGTLRDSPCPGYADPSNCPPFPTGGSGTISGVVSERTSDGLRPLVGVTVFAWVDLGDHGYARGGTRRSRAARAESACARRRSSTRSLIPVRTSSR